STSIASFTRAVVVRGPGVNSSGTSLFRVAVAKEDADLPVAVTWPVTAEVAALAASEQQPVQAWTSEDSFGHATTRERVLHHGPPCMKAPWPVIDINPPLLLPMTPVLLSQIKRLVVEESLYDWSLTSSEHRNGESY
ncbi:hypothetical protein FOZ62_001388, partial [Perkinsus olseni]